MPIIEVHLIEGRSDEMKKKLATAMTDAVCESIGAPRQNVRILITEHRTQEFYVGGITVTERAALQNTNDDQEQ